MVLSEEAHVFVRLSMVLADAWLYIERAVLVPRELANRFPLDMCPALNSIVSVVLCSRSAQKSQCSLSRYVDPVFQTSDAAQRIRMRSLAVHN